MRRVEAALSQHRKRTAVRTSSSGAYFPRQGAATHALQVDLGESGVVACNANDAPTANPATISRFELTSQEPARVQ